MTASLIVPISCVLQSLDREPSPFLVYFRALMVHFQGFGGGDPSRFSALTSSKRLGVLEGEMPCELACNYRLYSPSLILFAFRID